MPDVSEIQFVYDNVIKYKHYLKYEIINESN